MDRAGGDDSFNLDEIRHEVHVLYFRILGFIMIVVNDVTPEARDRMALSIRTNNVLQACNCPLGAAQRCNAGCSNRRRGIECSYACQNCRNRRIQDREFADVTMRCVGNGAFGVFAQAFIGIGNLVIEFVGQVMVGQEVTREHIVQIPHVDVYIDASVYCNESRAIRVQPNMANSARQVWIVGLEYRIVYVALRNIYMGEEITFDGYTYHYCHHHENGVCSDGSPARPLTMQRILNQPVVHEAGQRDGNCCTGTPLRIPENQIGAFQGHYTRARRLQGQIDQHYEAACNRNIGRSSALQEEQFTTQLPDERAIVDVQSPSNPQYPNVTGRTTARSSNMETETAGPSTTYPPGTSRGLSHDPTQPLPVRPEIIGQTVFRVPMANGQSFECTVPVMANVGGATTSGAMPVPPPVLPHENPGLRLTEELLEECGYNVRSPSFGLAAVGAVRDSLEEDGEERLAAPPDDCLGQEPEDRLPTLETINSADVACLGLQSGGTCISHDRIEEAVEVAASTGAAAVDAGLDVNAAAEVGAVAGNAVINHRHHNVPCSFCGELFPSDAARIEHEELCLENPNSGKLRCPYNCGSYLANYKTLGPHLKRCKCRPVAPLLFPGTETQAGPSTRSRAIAGSSARAQPQPPLVPVVQARRPPPATAVQARPPPPQAGSLPPQARFPPPCRPGTSSQASASASGEPRSLAETRRLQNLAKPFGCMFENCVTRFRTEKIKKHHEKHCIHNPERSEPQYKCPHCGREYHEKKLYDAHGCTAARLAKITEQDCEAAAESIQSAHRQDDSSEHQATAETEAESDEGCIQTRSTTQKRSREGNGRRDKDEGQGPSKKSK